MPEKKATEEIVKSIPGIVEKLMPEIPEIPSVTGGAIPGNVPKYYWWSNSFLIMKYKKKTNRNNTKRGGASTFSLYVFFHSIWTSVFKVFDD